MHWIFPTVSRSQAPGECVEDSREKDILKGLEVLVKVEERCNTKSHRRFASKKSRPDWDSALRLTKHAVDIFKSACDHERTIRALRQIAEIYKNIGLISLAVRSLEDAANISKNELLDCQKAADLYMEGYNLYIGSGMFERAANSVVKAAEVLDKSDIDRTLSYYSLACELYDNHAKPLAVPVVNSAIKYALSVERYDSACMFIRMLIKIHSRNFDSPRFSVSVLSLIVILLKMDCIDEAETALKNAREHPLEHPGSEKKYPPLLSNSISRVSEDLIMAAKLRNYALWINSFGALLSYPLDPDILKLTAVAPFPMFAKSANRRPVYPDISKRAIAPLLPKKTPSVDNLRRAPGRCVNP